MPQIKTEVTRYKNTKNGLVPIVVEESINYYWGIPLEQSHRAMLFSVIFKNEDARDKTKEFFSAFFRINPSLAHCIKGLEDN